MSELKFECSHCKQKLACDDQFAGREVRCASCQQLTTVPGVPPTASNSSRKSGMTFVPESWQKPATTSAPPVPPAPPTPSPPPKSGMTHVPDSWVKPPRDAKPEDSQ